MATYYHIPADRVEDLMDSLAGRSPAVQNDYLTAAVTDLEPVTENVTHAPLSAIDTGKIQVYRAKGETLLIKF